MNSRYINLFRFFFASQDLILLNLVHIVLVYVLGQEMSNPQSYMIFFLVTNILWLSCGYITGLYVNNGLIDFMRYSKHTVKAFLLYFFLLLLYFFVLKFNYSRLFLSLDIGSFVTLLILDRVIIVLWTSSRMGETAKKRVIVLGYNELSKKLVSYMDMNPERVSMEGYFEEYERVNELSNYPILGSIDESVIYAIKNNISEIYSTLSPEDYPIIYELATTAERNLIRFKFVPDFKLIVNRNVYLEYMQEIPVLSTRPEPLEDMANRVKKRVFDIAFSLAVIIFLLSWLMPIIAILVKLTSRGPIFFIQLRSGKDNQQFKCYKFRSLLVNTQSDLVQVTKGDSRYTPIGKFLRRSNIDELPQFFNVLIGNMSVVGPRPHMLTHTESFSKIINEYMIRHFVKPGVTGWAQINGYRGEIKEEMQLRKRIEYDIWYLENWSLWLDLKIIFLTVYNTMKGDKYAY
jgi:Undecaprenyl-phosphate glucose phosphotransferase